ncbi:MAG: polymer-forming cytoskeletal protein [Anaerolineales bacterium]
MNLTHTFPYNKKWIRAGLLIGLSLVIVLLTNRSAHAVKFWDQETIPAGVVVDDDVIMNHDWIIVDGVVDGDLITMGDRVIINGTINGSVMSFASLLEINGTVKGSIYTMSNSIILRSGSRIGRNVYAFTSNFKTETGSKIKRGLLIGGYQAILSGEVERDAALAISAFDMDGKVGGDLEIDISEPSNEIPPIFFFYRPLKIDISEPSNETPPIFFFYRPAGISTMLTPGMNISPEAEIGGKLTFRSEYDYSENILTTPGGGINHEMPPIEAPPPSQQEDKRVFLSHAWYFSQIRLLVILLILGYLAVRFIPSQFEQARDQLRDSPLAAARWGVVAFFGGYIGAFVTGILLVLLMILFGVVTLGGLVLSTFFVGFAGLWFLLTIFTFLILYGGRLTVAHAAGKIALERLAPQFADHSRWPVVTGVIIYVILSATPILGILINIISTVAGLGAIWLSVRNRGRQALIEILQPPSRQDIKPMGRPGDQRF